jgi:hypothetical protein
LIKDLFAERVAVVGGGTPADTKAMAEYRRD